MGGLSELETTREIADAESRRSQQLATQLEDARAEAAHMRAIAEDNAKAAADSRLLLKRAEAAHERERKAWSSRTEQTLNELAGFRAMKENEEWRKKKDAAAQRAEVQKARDMMSTMDRKVRAADNRKQEIAVNYRSLEAELARAQEQSDIMSRDYEAKISHATKVNDGLQTKAHKLEAANIELVGRLKVLTTTLKRNARFAKQCDDAAGMVDQIRDDAHRQWQGKLEEANANLEQLRQDLVQTKGELKQKCKQVLSEQGKLRKAQAAQATLAARLQHLQKEADQLQEKLLNSSAGNPDSAPDEVDSESPHRRSSTPHAHGRRATSIATLGSPSRPKALGRHAPSMRDGLVSIPYSSTSAASVSAIWVYTSVPLQRGAVVRLKPTSGGGTESGVERHRWRVSDDTGKLLETIDGQPHKLLDSVTDSEQGGHVFVEESGDP